MGHRSGEPSDLCIQKPRAWPPEESRPPFSPGNETGVCDQEGDVTPGFLQFPHLHLAILEHWRLSDWRRLRGFSEAAPVRGRVQPAGPGGQSPLRPPLLASHAHGAPHSHSCRHSGSELGLLGLSRWLICVLAAPWQEGAGEAGESSGLKEGGKWPVWLPAARRHPKYKNHEEGEAGAGKRRESLARGRGTWEKEETGGGTGAAVQGTANPPNAKGGPGSPGRRPGSRIHQLLQTRGLQALGRGHLSPRPPWRPPQPPGPHSGPFLVTRDAHSRHFPGARVTMPWCVFWSLLESGQAGDIRKKSAQTAPAPRARRLCFFRASVCPHPLISSGYDKALFLKSYFGLAGDLPLHAYLILGCRAQGSRLRPRPHPGSR